MKGRNEDETFETLITFTVSGGRPGRDPHALCDLPGETTATGQILTDRFNDSILKVDKSMS